MSPAFSKLAGCSGFSQPIIGAIVVAIIGAFRPRACLIAENLALRQQLTVLRRKRARPRLVSMPATLIGMRRETTTPLAYTAAAIGAMTALAGCTNTAETKNPCTSNIHVYVHTNPPEGLASTTGSCTPLVCAGQAESSTGCYVWQGNMLPASDGGPASCVVTFQDNRATTSVTFDVSYCSGTNNAEVGSDSVATVTDTGIRKGE